MIMAMHQPNYIPWLGYFHKMEKADLFVYLDSVQFPRGRSFAARNKIKTPQGPNWLTIPTSVPEGKKGKALYTEVEFNDEKWKNKHLKTLEMSYKKSPFFGEVFEILETHLMSATNLVELNIRLNDAIADYMGINVETKRLSGLLDSFGQKTQLIIDICKAVGAHTYLSGQGGGREYNDPDELQEHGIELTYDEFTHPEYTQLWGEFESHLSVIDLLFNCGPDSHSVLCSND